MDEAAGELGHDVLEIGTGPGITTDMIRQRVARLPAFGIDSGLTEPLRRHMAESNVNVINHDATDTG